MKTTLLAVLASLSLTTAAAAEASLGGNSETLTHDCATDAEVSVSGNSNEVTLTGVCTKVTLEGNSNKLTGSATRVSVSGNSNEAVLDKVDRLSVSGNSNKATYRGTVTAKLKKPKISKSGLNNTVAKAK